MKRRSFFRAVAGAFAAVAAPKVAKDNSTIKPVSEWFPLPNDIRGDLPTGKTIAIRTGLPSVQWRKLNEGVLPSKSPSRSR